MINQLQAEFEAHPAQLFTKFVAGNIATMQEAAEACQASVTDDSALMKRIGDVKSIIDGWARRGALLARRDALSRHPAYQASVYATGETRSAEPSGGRDLTRKEMLARHPAYHPSQEAVSVSLGGRLESECQAQESGLATAIVHPPEEEASFVSASNQLSDALQSLTVLFTDERVINFFRDRFSHDSYDVEEDDEDNYEVEEGDEEDV
jgi:hypothetical protein